ncbi:MAG: hypothetical protein PHD02_04330 [Bacilli bacterium]|nr:hypothetical protein [Bacilli bacterium]
MKKNVTLTTQELLSVLFAHKKDSSIVEVIKDPKRIESVQNPCAILKKLALQQDGLLLGSINGGVTDEDIDIALTQNGLAIYYVEKPTDEMQVKAVKQNVLAIFGIKNPCDKAITAVVNVCGYLIFCYKDAGDEAKVLAAQSLAKAKMFEDFENSDGDYYIFTNESFSKYLSYFMDLVYSGNPTIDETLEIFDKRSAFCEAIGIDPITDEKVKNK